MVKITNLRWKYTPLCLKYTVWVKSKEALLKQNNSTSLNIAFILDNDMRDSNSFTKLDKCYFFQIIIPLRLWVSSYGGVEIYPRFLFLFNLSSPSPSQLPIFLFLFSLKGPAKSFASSQIGRSIFSIPKKSKKIVLLNLVEVGQRHLFLHI